MSGENTNVNTPSEDNLKPSPTKETTDSEDTEKSDDISVFDLETFQKQLSRLDGKKQKTTIVLADTVNTPGSSCENDRIGDDMNKKQQHIVCECEPNVAGAAVPAVCSFNKPSMENATEMAPESQVYESDDLPVSDRSENHGSVSDRSQNHGSCSNRSDNNISERSGSSKSESPRLNKIKKSVTSSKPLMLDRKAIADNLKGNEKVSPRNIQKKNFIAANVKQILPPNNRSYTRKNSIQRPDNQIKKLPSSPRKDLLDRKSLSGRPSMIPKLTRPRTGGNRMDSKEKISASEKNDRVLNNASSISLGRRVPSINASSSSLLANEATNISVKMLDLKERVKHTTNLLRKKITSSTKTDNEFFMQACSSRSNIGNQEPKTIYQELNENIYRLETIALNIPSGSDLNTKKCVQSLLTKVNEIKEISNKFASDQNENSEGLVGNISSKNSRSSQTKDKDNKIHIKFMQSKEKSDKKLKKDSEKIQNQETPSTNPVCELQQTNKVSEDKVKTDSTVRETDSMDGVFIPSCEPPRNMEDEEDEANGLDITITFPEFNTQLSNPDGSHLSVKVADISEEALRKLKRCPKDFTLRMDFVQGKVVFQSGKAPVNNFLIGPDLKFVEHPVTDWKSEIIDIKPSTECRFTSQVISVENNKERTSLKSLKSTDSELFKVVKLPFIYKNPSISTVTKSCITFQNDNIFSMAIIARQVFKSMPHIASLSNLFEDRFVNLHHSVLHSTEKKRKNRPSNKKAITSNVVM